MKNFTRIVISLLFGLAVLTPSFVFAQSTVGQNFPPSTVGGNVPPSTVGNNAVFTLQDPLGVKNFCDLIKALLNIVLAIGVPVAVLFLVWSGFRFILARGRPGDLELARRNFYYVIIGIAVFLGAWTLATIISATIQTLDTSGTIQFCGR
jgi:hypothetical protein